MENPRDWRWSNAPAFSLLFWFRLIRSDEVDNGKEICCSIQASILSQSHHNCFNGAFATWRALGCGWTQLRNQVLQSRTIKQRERRYILIVSSHNQGQSWGNYP
ncbi:hypothetical protein F5X97DRAFT_306119 [Nemania serpens]|nr:hypothetical protein F5X97DRAFT_306119 [Nemania serpens]